MSSVTHIRVVYLIYDRFSASGPNKPRMKTIDLYSPKLAANRGYMEHVTMNYK